MALTDSQVTMWETVVALIHADGKVHKEEDLFLKDRFEKLDITPEQKQTLQRHIETPGNPRELFKKITAPRDRAQLIYFARLLFFSDGEFCDQEKLVLDHLESEVMGKADITAAMHEIDKVVVDYQQKHQERRDSQPLHRKIINALVFWEDLDNMG